MSKSRYSYIYLINWQQYYRYYEKHGDIMVIKADLISSPQGSTEMIVISAARVFFRIMGRIRGRT